MVEVNGVEKEFYGDWFIPNSTYKVPGKLVIYKSGESKLTMYSKKCISGEDFPKRVNMQPGFHEAKIILGKLCSHFNIRVTLYAGQNHNGIVQEVLVNNEYRELLYYPAAVFLDAHFEKPEDIKMQFYRFQVNGLGNWLNGDRFAEWLLKLHEKALSTELSNINGVTITHIEDALSGGNSEKSNLELRIFIELKSEDGCISFSDALTLQHEILSFFRFATLSNVTAGDLAFKVTEVYNHIYTYQDRLELKSSSCRHHFISYRTFGKDGLIRVFQSWMSKKERLLYPLDLFIEGALSVIFKNESPSAIQYANSFLNTVQAIEYLFKKNNGYQFENYIVEERSEQRELLERIQKKDLDQEDFKKISTALKRRNKTVDYAYTEDVFILSFNHAKEALVNHIEELHFTSIAQKVKTCRDALVHANQDNIHEVYRAFKVQKLHEAIQLLLLALVGQELELGKENIIRGINSIDIINWKLLSGD